MKGCCVGNTLYYYDGGMVQESSCTTSCGWDPGSEFYDCGNTGGDPSGMYPIACGLPNPVPADCAPE